MTVDRLIRRVLSLLGYTDTRADGEIPGGNDVYKRALPLVNQIAAELWYRDHDTPFAPLDLYAEIPLPAVTVQTTLPYGVAMLLAQTDGDTDNQTLFAGLYDGHRAAATASTQIRDVLPRVE